MIRKTSVALALVAGLFVGTAEAQQKAAPARLDLPEVKDWTLGNGLRVIYLGVHDAPVVTVQVYYHVGSKDEARDRRGSAHMFEHMMFKGTTHVPPEEHARLVDKLGGNVNAFTNFDVTGYVNTLPREHMDFAVRLEGERMRNLLFRKSMVDREREVVKEEKRMRVDNNPLGKAVEEFTALAFTQHPYAWTAAGDLADLDALTPEELKAFYDTYYQPNNAALVVVGDVSEAEVKASAEKWFGGIPRGGEPPRPADATPEPAQTATRKATAEKPAQVGIVIGGYKIPPARHPDLIALRIAASILSDGESSRLYQRVVRKDKSGVAAGGQLLELEHPGLFFVYAAHLGADEAPRIEKALLDEMARLGKAGPTAAELAKAKNQLAARFVFTMEDVAGLAGQIGNSWIMTGDPRAFLRQYDAIWAVTAADVKRVASTYLAAKNLTLMFVPPFGGGK
jgi:zinc protease